MGRIITRESPVLFLAHGPWNKSEGRVIPNPTGRAIQLINQRKLFPQGVVGAVLPTSWRRGDERIAQLIAKYRPRIIVGLGVVPSQIHPIFKLEKYGANAEAGIDVDGKQPPSAIIEDGGPPRVATNLDYTPAQNAIVAGGAQFVDSTYAGQFICNENIYEIMRDIQTGAFGLATGTTFGFIHCPQAWDILPQEIQETALNDVRGSWYRTHLNSSDPNYERDDFKRIDIQFGLDVPLWPYNPTLPQFTPEELEKNIFPIQHPLVDDPDTLKKILEYRKSIGDTNLRRGTWPELVRASGALTLEQIAKIIVGMGENYLATLNH